MDLDLRNKRDLYPCNLSVESASSALISVADYIKYLRICVRSKLQYTAFITQVSEQQITVKLLPPDGVEQISVRFSVEGTAYSSDPHIDLNNSFAVFIPLNRLTVITGTYNIPLLAECVLYIPPGLRIKCTFSDPKAVGTYIDYKDQTHSYLFDTSLNFIPGYNCLPISASDLIILAAGTGLGAGNIKKLTVVGTLGSAYAGGVVKQVKGMRAINGQTRDVAITTQGSVGLRLSLTDNTLTLTFFTSQDLLEN